jgi:hypothetical protein
MNFFDFLSYLEEEMQHNLLSGRVVHLVTVREASLACPIRLRELLADLYSPSHLHLTPRYRS